MATVNSFKDIEKIFNPEQDYADREIKRGDIYYIKALPDVKDGCVQQGGRPGIVIGNDIGNQHSPVAIIVYVTTADKRRNMPTHVELSGLPEPSIALCEQIVTVSKDRLCDYMGQLTDIEMLRVDHALEVSIALKRQNGGAMMFETGDNTLLQEAREKIILISDVAKRINATETILKATESSKSVCFEGEDIIKLDSILPPEGLERIKSAAIDQILKYKKADEDTLKALMGIKQPAPVATPATVKQPKAVKVIPAKRLTQKIKAQVEQLYKAGKEMDQIAEVTGIDLVRISRYIKESGLGEERYKGKYVPSTGSAPVPNVSISRR